MESAEVFVKEKQMILISWNMCVINKSVFVSN